MIKKIILLGCLSLCMPVIANEKVEFCQMYKDHLNKMKEMQTRQNFSYKSKEWIAAEDEKEVLAEQGKMLFGDDVTLTNACSGLLNMIKSKQFQSFQ